jgi:hypothetical protein
MLHAEAAEDARSTQRYSANKEENLNVYLYGMAVHSLRPLRPLRPLRMLCALCVKTLPWTVPS